MPLHIWTMRRVTFTPLRLRTTLAFLPRRAYALHHRDVRSHTNPPLPAALLELRPQAHAAKHNPSAATTAKHAVSSEGQKTEVENVSPMPWPQDSEEQMTFLYVKKHFVIPERSQYPLAPQGIWNAITKHPTDLSVKYTHRLFDRKLNFQSISYKKWTAKTRSGKALLYRCKMVTIAHPRAVVAIGDGANNSLAYKAAIAHLVAKLHESGDLQKLYGQSLFEDVKADRHGVPVEFLNNDPRGLDHLVSVYESASRFTALPTLLHEPVTKNILAQARRRGIKPRHQCTIEIPELQIKVIGAGTTQSQAVAAAGIPFEREISRRPGVGKPLGISAMDSFENFWYRSEKSQLLTRSKEVQAATRSRSAKFVSEATLAGEPIGEPITTKSKETGKKLAMLTAAIALAKKDPTLLPRFEAELQANGGKIMRTLPPVDVYMPREALHHMRHAIQLQTNAQKTPRPVPIENDPDSTPSIRRVRKVTDHDDRNVVLQKAFEDYQASSSTETMRQKRDELPINQHRTEILDMVSQSPFSVVVGATGSGKTTQVPQIFLEAASTAGEGATCNVICTQPRRIAATSVARRVADERAEKVGDTVGFIVRHNSSPPQQDGSVLFCTSGILLQQLQHDPDQVFDTTSHILLDEVHERDIILDFLLVVLKKALEKRVEAKKPVPKVVLMSATMNTELFAEYFGSTDASGQRIPCPSINVPGRLFPVKDRYLGEIHDEIRRRYTSFSRNLESLFNEKDTEKYLKLELEPTNRKPEDAKDQDDPDDALTPLGLVAATVAHVANTTDEGAILVFLPGQNEILQTQRLLTRSPIFNVNFGNTDKFKLFVLHSSTKAEDQAAVFEPVPKGCRKIILSTNIAETSVTIPDVQHVVDSGKHRENRYDTVNRITALKSGWISKANAKQRAGRAGRVQNGNYYGLYTKERLDRLKITGQAEMLRSDLQEICLDVKAHGFKDSVSDFLAQALEPPAPVNVHAAIETLKSLEAFTEKEELSPLGELLAALPVQPGLGKMILLGIIFRCLDPLIILGTLSGARSLFLKPSGARTEWQASHRKWLQNSQSEHIAQIKAYTELRRIFQLKGWQGGWEFAQRNFISVVAYEQIRRAAEDIEQILVKSKLIPYTPPAARYNNMFGSQNLNANSENVPLLKALALVGFAPNLSLHTFGRWFRSRNSDEVAVHPKSTIGGRNESVQYNRAMFTYSTMLEDDSGSLFMRDVTEVSHAATLLFGGKLKMNQQGHLALDEWLPIRVERDSRVVYQFRQALDKFLSNAFRSLKTHRTQDSFNRPGDRNTSFADSVGRDPFAYTFVDVINELDHRTKMSIGHPKSAAAGPGQRRTKYGGSSTSRGAEKEEGEAREFREGTGMRVEVRVEMEGEGEGEFREETGMRVKVGVEMEEGTDPEPGFAGEALRS
ncbi:P-loop containing nucleoside triphosphate hydrolase protein [Massarina eburnea CBS 473.64]|uniref:RNA helicase n=1 Tax=Massarina eburnea CBS 473.64 TaxID=1395130 RepID=A0A6A6RRD6_9PLEO|nr:P-loop containing nucleoside triphosphate hydrolase protein [Massarina eburnea CBS 473.64]